MTTREELIEVQRVDREEWARRMRLLFTPADMRDEHGNLRNEYFRPKLANTSSEVAAAVEAASEQRAKDDALVDKGKASVEICSDD
jgi:hypothetical protein